MKYTDTDIVFQEFPDEVTLAINISNCPNRCPGCHSPELWDNIGEELTFEILDKLIAENKGITCIGLMGGDKYPIGLRSIMTYIRDRYPELKIGWYSGKDELIINPYMCTYYKLGPYIAERGPLNNPNTNQRMFKQINPGEWVDITNRFWK